MNEYKTRRQEQKEFRDHWATLSPEERKLFMKQTGVNLNRAFKNAIRAIKEFTEAIEESKREDVRRRLHQQRSQ